MVENGRLGRPRGVAVVVGGDRVQKLGAHLRVERLGPLLDEPQAEMDVAEQPPLLGRPEGRTAAQLADASDVVQKRRGEQEIGAEPGVELRRLARQRRDADGVLEQPARVGMVCLGGRQLPQRLPDLCVAEEAPDHGSQAGMRQLRGDELEEAVQLVGVAAHPGREVGRILLGSLDGADLELKPVVEALDASEHAHGVALGEAAVQQLDVLPDPRLDPAGRVDQLEHQVRRALSGRPPLLAGDGVDTFDRAVGRQLGDGAHESSLGRC